MNRLRGELIAGPTLRDIQALGLDGRRVDIATAFYSARALDSLNISAAKVNLFCRVDLTSIDEWCGGHVAPDALLNKMETLTDTGAKVSLFGHAKAHAKAYVGSKGALVGSANLTLRGFGAGCEIVVHTRGAAEVELVRKALSRYQRQLTEIDIDELREYVRKNSNVVKKCQKNRPKAEDRLPNVPRDKISAALGSYDLFLKWLDRQIEDSARETLDRANGKGNLQGHIHRNFYGLRQFFLAYPELQVQFSKQDSNTYKLSKDPVTERLVAEFVKNHAANEDDFDLSIWMTYLPRECGGRAGKHGGTIGNLNRMLPLVAKYLQGLRLQRRA
jgi:hypothetical protein